MKRTVLIVDGGMTERIILKGLLKADYNVIEAESGREAIEILKKKYDVISVVIMAIDMPRMDGFQTLKAIRANSDLLNIPVVITTGMSDEDSREKAISFGADNFVTKPFNQKLLSHVLLNAVRVREASAIVNTLLRDNLTGLLNHESFFREAERMINRHEPGYYILSSYNIENFKVINDQYGSQIGDEVLRHIGNCLGGFAGSINGLACRYMADRFMILFPKSMKDSDEVRQNHELTVSPPCLARPIRIRIGRYTVADKSLSPSAMFDRATMAESSIKGRYDIYIAEYTEAMRDNLLYEQQIVNDMTDALRNGEFEPWFQPQYNHATGALIGSEALVRWRRNGKIVSPGSFIPVFEKNGFIYEVDQYVWRSVCSLLRKWLDEGSKPLPVSVNISRYDLLQKDFVEVISGLIKEFDLPHDLLRLEITESAFSEAADAITVIARELILLGFTLEIDDFGSGYSSFNTLKDLPATILKLDMRFFENSENSERGGNIIESVVRMAKWLGMAVIAEGVEERAQADYLKSIGCYYIQGYYYAKPMPQEEYEFLFTENKKETKLSHLETINTLDNSRFWDPKSMETLIFNSYVGAACILEYSKGNVEMLRAADYFIKMLGSRKMTVKDALELDWTAHLNGVSRSRFNAAVVKSLETQETVYDEFEFINLPGCPRKTILRSALRVIAVADERYLVYCQNENITAQHEAQRREHELSVQLQAIMNNMLDIESNEMAKYQVSRGNKTNISGRKTILIVDDSSVERAILSGLLNTDYDIATAVGGEEALAMLSVNYEQIAAIVLDIIMPDMDGYEVMRRIRSMDKLSNIPIIVSTALEDDETREKAITYGANGFITKPFNRTLLLYAVQNAVRLRDMITITEQMKAEEQQEKLLDNLPNGAGLYEYDGERIKAMYINKSFWKLMEREPGSCGDDFAEDFIHPDDHDMLWQELRSAIRQNRNMEVDVRIVSGDGSYRPFRVVASITSEPVGTYTLFATFTLISEDALAIQQMLPVALSTMMSSSGDYSYVKDRDCRYVCCSYNVAKLFGLETERDIIGKTDSELFDGRMGDEFMENIRVVIETGRPIIDRQEEIPRAEGGILFVRTSIYPIINSLGHVIGLYGISHDVSEEHKLNFELDTLLNTIPSGILKYAADETEQFEYINRNFIESLGYTQETFKEKFNNCFSEMVWHEDREWAANQIITQEVDGKIGKFDYRVEAADGKLHWIHDEGIQITDRDGKSWYYVSLVDITESHEAYEQLKLMADSMPSGLATYVCTQDEIAVSYCNNDFCKLFETTYDRFDEIVTADPMAYVYEEDRGVVLKQYNMLRQDNITFDCIYRIYVRGGDVKWVHQRAVISERRGDTVYINSALFDITVQQEAREKLRVSEELNRIAMEHSGKIVAQFNVRERALILPELATPIFEVPRVLLNIPEEQIAKGAVSEETAEDFRQLFYDIIAGVESGTAVFQEKSIIGWRWLQASFTTVFSDAKEPVYAVITFEDITERLERELIYSKWQQSLTERSDDSYTLFRCNLSKNATFDSWVGTLIDLDNIENKSDFHDFVNSYVRRVYAEDRDRFLSFINSDVMLAGYYRGNRVGTIEYRELGANGATPWLMLSVELVEYPNSRDIEAYLMFEDINSRKMEELQIKEQAETDPLTGVLNRTTFALRIDAIIAASAPGTKHALMMTDLDNFKYVNDTYGHDVGDRVLIDTTRRMHEMLRHDDLIGRLGGDEFFIFLKDIPDASAASTKAAQICDGGIPVLDTDDSVTISIGIAMVPDNGVCFEELYKKADVALYQRKAAGKNGFQFVIA